MDSSRLDDEHKLIARYAQRLAQEARTMVSPLTFTHLILTIFTQLRAYIIRFDYSSAFITIAPTPLNLQRPRKLIKAVLRVSRFALCALLILISQLPR